MTMTKKSMSTCLYLFDCQSSFLNHCKLTLDLAMQAYNDQYTLQSGKDAI